MTWTSHHVPNTNQFYLKFITGNIRGYRNTLCLVDGFVPQAPHDLTVARAEKQPYRDSSVNLITPQKESTVHYHCHVSCIRAVKPLFIPSSLTIPADIYSHLTSTHWEYIQGIFNI